MPRRPRTFAAGSLSVVLALVLASCGGSDTSDTTATTTTPAAPTTTSISTSSSNATTTTAAPSTTVVTATITGDLPTEFGAGIYLVGSEILPGVWSSNECGCPWSVVDADGTKTAGTGDDAVVPADAHSIELGGCIWSYRGE